MAYQVWSPTICDSKCLGCRSAVLRDHPFVFMRWKELFFVDYSEDCSLTIAGFYYICLCRESGRIRGYYFEPKSRHPQELELQNDGGPYFSHGKYQFT